MCVLVCTIDTVRLRKTKLKFRNNYPIWLKFSLCVASGWWRWHANLQQVAINITAARCHCTNHLRRTFDLSRLVRLSRYAKSVLDYAYRTHELNLHPSIILN